MKQFIQRALGKVNLTASRRRPYLNRRYPYRGASSMRAALGPDLSQSVVWSAVDARPVGALAAVFSRSPGLHKWVHYLPVYEGLIDRSRPLRMLEIGVFQGGSLAMWRDYLDPGSVIVGVDIDPGCKQFDDPRRQVHVRIGGQQDRDFLLSVVKEFGPFDVIIDDGSHMTSHMVESFRQLFATALVDGGLYIAEDVHSNYWKSHRDSSLSFVDFTAALIDAMHAHYHSAEGEKNFRIGHPDRFSDVSVPKVTPMLGSIEIHDSMFVVRKAARTLPHTVYVTSPNSRVRPLL